MSSVLKLLEHSYHQKLHAQGIPTDPSKQSPDQQPIAALLLWAARSEIMVDAESLVLGAAPPALSTPRGPVVGAPNPIPFSIAAAQRSGTATTAVMTYPGGYSALAWTLTGLGTGAGSDYENPANSVTTTMFYSTDGGVTYGVFQQVVWQGGPYSFRGVIDPPPSLSMPLANLPTGCKAYFQFDLTDTFTVGLSGTMS